MKRERDNEPAKVRFFHYTPRPEFRSQDASSWCASLKDDLTLWIAQAISGQRRGRLTSSRSASIARGDDEIHCDIAQALAAAKDWDGFSIAHELKLRGWPADVDLVRLCNVWSCSLWAKVKARRLCRADDLRGASV